MNTDRNAQQNSSRVLATMGAKKCPLGCIYCFVDNEAYPGLPSAESFLETKSLVGCADIIQPAADVEYFLVPGHNAILKKLSSLGCHISFSTKWRLTATDVNQLAQISETLAERQRVLQIAVSIVKLDDWNEIETKAPSPLERIQTLKLLSEAGISTSLALRPLLPFVSQEEIREILKLASPYVQSVLTGPVYLTPALMAYMQSKHITFGSEKKLVNWIPGKVQMDVYKNSSLESFVHETAGSFGLPVFVDNVAVVRHAAKLRFE